MTSYDNYSLGRDMDSLVTGLQHLLSHYRDLLREEGMKQDVKRLLDWLERLESGEWRLEPRIEQQGHHMLEVLHHKLLMSAEDHARIEDESPANATPRIEAKAVRFAEASVEVQELIRLLLEEFESHP